MARVLTIPALAGLEGFVHGFSTLALGSVAISAEDGAEARARFAAELGLDPAALTIAGAIHGSAVAEVGEPSGRIADHDGLVTSRRGIALCATFADCYPILVLDPRRRAAGLAHAGWRGTAAGVARNLVGALVAGGSRARDLVAGIGPGICGRCYEVGPEVSAQADSRFRRQTGGGRLLLDLEAANRDQLLGAGVREVHSIHVCTLETENLPSHRRDGDGRRFGAAVAVR